jgi:thymidine phosphorylase
MVLAEVARELGAGRFSMSDSINPGIGYVLHTSRNQHISRDQTWISIHHDLPLSSLHLSRINDALQIGTEPTAEFHRLIRIIT